MTASQSAYQVSDPSTAPDIVTDPALEALLLKLKTAISVKLNEPSSSTETKEAPQPPSVSESATPD